MLFIRALCPYETALFVILFIPLERCTWCHGPLLCGGRPPGVWQGHAE